MVKQICKKIVSYLALVIAPYFVTLHVGHGSKSMQFAFLSFNYRMLSLKLFKVQ